MAPQHDEPEDDGSAGELLLYVSEDGRTRLDVRFESGTLWLSLNQIARLYQSTKQNINLHILNIFREGEMSREATVKERLTVQTEGKRQVRRSIEYFSLPVILSVGFRVKSGRGTQFRQWAAGRLNEYLVKGFVMDDERLKNPPGPGVPDHFDELLERIRDIRASERRMYLRVKGIFALAADYQPAAAAQCPQGTPSQSPGLRGTSYPGLTGHENLPQRGCGRASSTHGYRSSTTPSA